MNPAGPGHQEYKEKKQLVTTTFETYNKTRIKIEK